MHDHRFYTPHNLWSGQESGAAGARLGCTLVSRSQSAFSSFIFGRPNIKRGKSDLAGYARLDALNMNSGAEKFNELVGKVAYRQASLCWLHLAIVLHYNYY